MTDNKVRFWNWVACGVLAVVIAYEVNWLLTRASAQYDLTQDGRYTIPPALKRIAANFAPNDPDARLKITVYLSDNLPRYLAHLPRTIRTRLSEVRRASGDKIEYEFIDPKDNVDLVADLEKNFKITALPMADVREGEITQGSYFLAMVFRYRKEAEPLQLRDIGQELMKEDRTLAILPGLIATKLLKVTTPDEIVVGIVSDKKQPPQQQQQQQNKPTDNLETLRDRLKAHCRLKDVNLKGGVPVPPDIKALLVYKPEALAPADVFQLDQFMMRGGRVILLVDNYSIIDWDRIQAIEQALQQEKFSLRPIDSGLKDWLRFYGFDIRPGVVMDRMNHKVMHPAAGNPRMMELADMPSLLNVRELDADKKPTEQLNREEMTLSGIGALAFLVATPMQLDADAFAGNNPGATLQGLAWSSKESWVMKDPPDTIPEYAATPPPREEWGRSVLVGRASGPLRSYWADKEAPRKADSPMVESAASDAGKLTAAAADKPAQLWVVADTDFANDVWPRVIARNPLDANARAGAQGMGVSSAMVMNMVDVAALGQDLVEIRNQRLIDRSIEESRVRDDRGMIKFYNIGLMPLVFVVLGLLWWAFRSVHTFVPSPRQPITVPPGGPPVGRELDVAAVSEKGGSHS